MKFLLLMAVLFVSCTTTTTKTTDSSQEQKVASADTVIPPPISLSISHGCEGMRSPILELLRTRVPELEAIGAPYVKRAIGGALTYTMVRCPLASADDPLIRNYYEIGVGFSEDEAIPLLWYRFYFSKDLGELLVAEIGTTPKPVDEVRASAKWKSDWESRK